MYYAHFGLKQPPFKITPNTEFFFTGGNRGVILDALMYAVTSGEGIVKVVGEVGSGKTMLCRMLQTILPPQVERVYLANPSVAPEDVLHTIAFELQLEIPRDADRLHVMQALQRYLLDKHAEGKQVVIFVEEAQGMPLATLEEIRLLSNLETRQDKLLQIVLFGQPELDANLNSNQIRQLRERITHSFNLSPLNEAAVGEYLIFRLRAAGYFGPHLFHKKSIAMMAKSAEGLVRRVNILADKALLAAFADNSYLVTPSHVKAAIKDSEFGAEQQRQQFTKLSLIVIAATLAIGLAAGYLLNVYLPHPVPASAGAPISDQAKQSSASADLQLKPPQASASAAVPSSIADLPVQAPARPAVEPSSPAPADAKPPEITQNQGIKQEQGKVKQNTAPNPVQPGPVTALEAAKATLVNSPGLSNSAASNSTASKSGSSVSDEPASGDIVQLRLDETQAWLKQQAPSTVSIQLMGSSNKQQLSRQINALTAQLGVNNIYLYTTQVAGQPFISVLYGSFANRQEALHAVEQLPQALKMNNPHLRTVAGILKETNQFQ